jgi:hypothetical protein
VLSAPLADSKKVHVEEVTPLEELRFVSSYILAVVEEV